MEDHSSKCLKILFIARTFPPVIGGIEKQNAEIHTHLSKIADITLVANRRGKSFLPFFLPYAVIYALCRARRYDVVLLGDGILAVVAWALRWIRPRPLTFCILHGLDLTFPKTLYQSCWIRRFLPQVDVLLPVSRQTASEAIKRGLREERCRVIPNGVNLDEFTQEYNYHQLRRLLGCDIEGRRIILTVGRLIERKGVHWFVENVMPELDKDIVYVVAGDGPMRETIKKVIMEKGLGARIFMLGRVSDDERRTLYAASDIFIQPNIPVDGDMEGFGLVVLEAGASGLPVIASRLEGLTDAISEGDNGQLLTPGDADEYITQIHRLIRDKDALHLAGQSALSYVRRHFQWKAIAEIYMKTFMQFLQESCGKSSHESSNRL